MFHTKHSGAAAVLPECCSLRAPPSPNGALGTHQESNLGVMPGVGFTRDGSSLLMAGVTKSWLNLQVRYRQPRGFQVTGARMTGATKVMSDGVLHPSHCAASELPGREHYLHPCTAAEVHHSKELPYGPIVVRSRQAEPRSLWQHANSQPGARRACGP